MRRLSFLLVLGLVACAVEAAPAPPASDTGLRAPPPVKEPSPTAAPPPASTSVAPPAVAAAPSTSASAGAPSAGAPPSPCPREMAAIGRFCVERWEAHLVALGPTGELRRHPHFARPPSQGYFEARSAAGVMPQAYISRDEAETACTRAGKRLCTWLEWRRACQGRAWRRYPYGHARRRGACNVNKKHLLHELHGDDKPWTYEHFNDPALGREPGFLAASGAHEDCVSADGTYDMNGNVHEWVSTPVTESFVERMEAEEELERIEQPWTAGNGMFLGGFFSTDEQHGPGCHYTTIAHEPSYHDYSTGFRCCADARPSED